MYRRPPKVTVPSMPTTGSSKPAGLPEFTTPKPLLLFWMVPAALNLPRAL